MNGTDTAERTADGTTFEPLFYSIGEACTVLRLSRSTVNRLIANGELESRKVGRRRLIPVQALRSLAAA